jgi:hypothetical protein
MDDWVTDHYQTRIKQGEIINNPCYYVKRETSETEGTWVNKSPADGHSYWYEFSGISTSYFLSLDPVTLAVSKPANFADCAKIAKFKALANVDSTPYSFGEDALSIAETIRFLTNPMEGLLRLSKSFRRDVRKRTGAINWRVVESRARAVSNAWLQYRFAVSPLLRSIISGLEAYSDKPKTMPPRLSARGFASDKYNFSEQVSVPDYRTYLRSVDDTIDCKASILYEVTNPIYNWSYRLGFRNKDLPTVLWQIVPYSFMVDRVIDVTSFCKGVINLADPRVKMLAGDVRTKAEDVFNIQCNGGNRPGWYYSGSCGTRTIRTFKYTRDTWTPSFRDTIPTLNKFGLVDSASKLIDLGTLILQNFK